MNADVWNVLFLVRLARVLHSLTLTFICSPVVKWEQRVAIMRPVQVISSILLLFA